MFGRMPKRVKLYRPQYRCDAKSGLSVYIFFYSAGEVLDRPLFRTPGGSAKETIKKICWEQKPWRTLLPANQSEVELYSKYNHIMDTLSTSEKKL